MVKWRWSQPWLSLRRRRMFESCHCWCNTLRADQQSKQDRHYSYLVYHRLSVGLLRRKRGLNPCMFCVVPLRSAVFLTFCVTCLDLVSVQFSSRWYLCARKSPYALHPVSEVSPTLPWRFLFPRLSPPGDRWCDVLGFVPAGSVSSFSTLQIFREQATCEGCFARQSICSVISLHSGVYVLNMLYRGRSKFRLCCS